RIGGITARRIAIANLVASSKHIQIVLPIRFAPNTCIGIPPNPVFISEHALFHPLDLLFRRPNRRQRSDQRHQQQKQPQPKLRFFSDLFHTSILRTQPNALNPEFTQLSDPLSCYAEFGQETCPLITLLALLTCCGTSHRTCPAE